MKLKKRFNVVRLGKGKVDFISKYNTLILLCVLFVSGVIIGASALKSGGALAHNSLAQVFTRFYAVRGAQPMLASFAYSMLIHMVFLGASFTFGMCSVGAPAVCALPFLRGVSLGVIAAFLYQSYALDGVGHFMLTMLPGTAVAVSLLLVSCNESYKTSMDILRMLTKGTAVQGGVLKRYVTVYLILIGLTALASLVDTVLARVFAGLFVLG